jgi:hypothetical protein
MRFVDAHGVLDGCDRMEHLLAMAPAGSCVAGWSLGSLLLERLLREGRVPPKMPALSVCPFLDFCDPAGPWKPLVLRRMTRRLFGDAAGVLSDFADLLGLEGDVRRGWFQQGIALGEESLAAGLSALESLRFQAPWAEHPRRLFAVSPDDPVSPRCEVPEELRRTLPVGSGHVPFLKCPEALREILLELSGRIP